MKRLATLAGLMALIAVLTIAAKDGDRDPNLIELSQAIQKNDLQKAKAILAEHPGILSGEHDDSRQATHLALATSTCDREMVELILAEVGDPNGYAEWFGLTPLHCCAKCSVEICEILVSADANVNAHKASGYSPLEWAAKNDNQAMAELLLSKGAKVNSVRPTPSKNYMPAAMEWAAINGNGALVKILADAGAEVNVFAAASADLPGELKALLKDDPGLATATGYQDKTPLHFAAGAGNKKACKTLLSKKADLEARDQNLNTPLFAAVEKDQAKAMEFLLKKGANLKAVNKEGLTPLHLAARAGKTEICKTLLKKGAELNALVAQGFYEGATPMLVAMREEHAQTAQMMRDHGGYYAKDVHEAAREGDLNRLKKEAKDDPKALSAPDWTTSKNTPLHIAARHGRIEVVRFLIEAGVDVNERSGGESTALHRAASGGHLEICKLLLEKGVEVDVQNSTHQTPLQWAADSGRLEVCQFLVSKGAEVNSSGTEITALHKAARSGHPKVCAFLLDQGAKVNSQGSSPLHYAASGASVETCRLLVERGADVNAEAMWGTPLYEAASNDTKDVSEFLISKGADVNGRGSRGTTPLHKAAQYDNENLEFLVSKGADVNAEDGWGVTPLHKAAEDGETKNCEFLIAKGAKVNAKNQAGKTPLKIALERDNQETAELLRKHGGKE